MKEKILVTGGAGYIGSHVTKLLREKDCDVLVIDNFSTGYEKALLGTPFKKVDLAERDKLESILEEEQFSSVYHFAGSIIVPESVSHPELYYMNNTFNAISLIDLCVKHKVKNFIFSSTAAVYGFPEGGKASESSPLNPLSPYGRTKMAVEWYLEDVCRVREMNYVALRYFNVAGAHEDGSLGQSSKNATHLIKLACQAALGKRDQFAIYGTDYETKDGTCVRDYIHIQDLAQAHLDALSYLSGGAESVSVNCGYGQGFTVKEVVEMVKKVSQVDFPVEESARRAGDPDSIVAHSEKIKQLFSWQPRFDDLEFIVKTAFDWEKNRPY
jgi:UDP-glucose 4-epimerase